MKETRILTFRVDADKWSVVERFRATAVKRRGRAWGAIGEELIHALELYLEKYEK